MNFLPKRLKIMNLPKVSRNNMFLFTSIKINLTKNLPCFGSAWILAKNLGFLWKYVWHYNICGIWDFGFFTTRFIKLSGVNCGKVCQIQFHRFKHWSKNPGLQSVRFGLCPTSKYPRVSKRNWSLWSICRLQATLVNRRWSPLSIHSGFSGNQRWRRMRTTAIASVART